jgi:hypothetical protein
MDKKELKRLYKETKPSAGVFQIKNTINGKIFVDSVPNLKSMNGQQFMLETGSHMNPALQQEWRQFGKKAFVFEVLEVLEQKEDDYSSPKDALKKLEEKWLEKLQPYGDQGYNDRQPKHNP